MPAPLVPQVLAAPISVILNLVAEQDPGVDRTSVARAIEAVAGGRAKQRRLAQALLDRSHPRTAPRQRAAAPPTGARAGRPTPRRPRPVSRHHNREAAVAEAAAEAGPLPACNRPDHAGTARGVIPRGGPGQSRPPPSIDSPPAGEALNPTPSHDNIPPDDNRTETGSTNGYFAEVTVHAGILHATAQTLELQPAVTSAQSDLINTGPLRTRGDYPHVTNDSARDLPWP